MKPIAYITTAILSLLMACASQKPQNNTELILQRLDHAIESNETYMVSRLNRIGSLESMLPTMSIEQQYLINRRLYDEYFAFNFDKSLACLESNLAIARQTNDPNKLTNTNIELAMLYSVSGMYLEARETFSLIDTTSLSKAQRLHYCQCRHRFLRDFIEYTKNSNLGNLSLQQLNYYRQQIYQLSDPKSETAQSTLMLEYIDKGDYDNAKQTATRLVERFKPEDHSYAIYSYYLGSIGELQNDTQAQIVNFAQSAISDVQLAVKDNASLCSLANTLFRAGDLERAFKYIEFSINDALYYNAKLRPWQIASVLPAIEESYQAMIVQKQRAGRQMMIMIGVLAVVMLLICIYVVVLYRRTRSTGRQLEAKNRQINTINLQLSGINSRLQTLNHQIAEANTVKEEYIGLFLSICSSYIDRLTDYQRHVRRQLKEGKGSELLKESSPNEQMQKELDDFYEMFDNAFLRLYPNFVEEFNSLLEQDGRICLRKDEKLNTELRIFALIRLGINDSSKIAALLRYSVNTIYNYRAKVKNRAIGDRENFEEVIKTIGSFKSNT